MTSSSGRQRHADHDANWTKSQDEGHVEATKRDQSPRAGSHAAPLLGTPGALLLKRSKLRNLKNQVEAQLRAVENALLMYSDVPIEAEKAAAYAYTDREMKAAHTMHAAGERTPWVDAGERAYQRQKKRAERARKKAA